MKFNYAASVSTLALLVATALGGRVKDCPTIKTVLSRSVVSGRSARYTVRVVAGTRALTDADVTILLPEGVNYDSASVRPRSLGSPAVSDRTLSWSSVDLTTRKSFSFKVKVNVDNCTPAQLPFRARVVGGTCNVDAEPEFTDVKRSKKSNTCAPTNNPTTAPTTGAPTGAATDAPTLPLPGTCAGNGNCQDGDQCVVSIPINSCGPNTCPPEFVGGLILCGNCTTINPLNEIACTGDNSGACSTIPGGPTNCGNGQNKGYCYCSLPSV